MPPKRLSVIELCAGAGGAAIGLEQAGFAHAALIDNNEHCCATLLANRPTWNVINADIRHFDACSYRGVDLVSGGLPCPPFSIAGKQLGADDDRDMFPSMLRIVGETQPRAVLIENVRGILAKRFDTFRQAIDAAFEDMGFETSWALLNASDFGVPQMRARAFLVAIRRGSVHSLVWPQRNGCGMATVGESIADLIAERGWTGADDWVKQATIAAPTIVGGSHKHGGPDLGPTRARKEWAEIGVDGLGLADEAPGHDFRGMPRLTVRMIARLQGFPDEWQFVGRKTQAYRQVGNALPPRLACVVAKAVMQCLVG